MRNIGLWGAGRIAGAAFVPDPSPLLSSRRDRRGSLQQQETGLQVRSSQDRPAEAKIFQKMCVLTGVTNPRWLEQAIGSKTTADQHYAPPPCPTAESVQRDGNGIHPKFDFIRNTETAFTHQSVSYLNAFTRSEVRPINIRASLLSVSGKIA